jgi:hypothetical protein
MRRRDFLAGSGGSLLYAARPSRLLAFSATETLPERGLLFAVDSRCSADVHLASQQLVASVAMHPLLSVMAGGGCPALIEMSQLFARPDELAYNHVILIGRPDDPLLTAASQREAHFSSGGVYVFGFGAFLGDCGYIESDRNPFLHVARISSAPFETELITITGTSDQGILLALETFKQHSLINGIMAEQGWQRTENTLLDRDPLSPSFTPPALAPTQFLGYSRIGITQAAEDEYRGVLADAGFAPQIIWRAKYYRPGAWDAAGAAAAFDAYSNGLHRRAYGSTLWLAEFTDSSQAAAAVPKIAAAARLSQKQTNLWAGEQPAYANGTYPGEHKSSGPLSLVQHGAWLMMSTLQGTALSELLSIYANDLA